LSTSADVFFLLSYVSVNLMSSKQQGPKSN
jgi:hypothetical protein